VPSPEPNELFSADEIRTAAQIATESLPAPFVERLRSDFPQADGITDRLLAATALDLPRGLRLNPLRGELDQTIRELDELGIESTPVGWAPWARVIPRTSSRAITETEAWREGRVVLQSLTSMLAVMGLAPRPGERILDLCAAPGGKTALIAAMVENDAQIIANDRSRTRCMRMRAMIRMLGAEAAIRTSPGERIPFRDHGTFDRVLVDAPCSGEGRFRSDDPGSHEKWSVKGVRRLASVQKSLLHAAIQAVRPGGVIVYSTCTLGREENEAILDRALTRYGEGPTGMSLDPLPPELPDGLALLDPPLDPSNSSAAPSEIALRRYGSNPRGAPEQAAMEGFFVARLRRRGGVEAP
jgi:16S rRNA C967 or C1407 C5-methylase (RsmB/RsmF family)